MPMKLAANKLFVRCEDMPSGGEKCTNGCGEETAVTDLSRDNLNVLFESSNVSPRPEPNRATRGDLMVPLFTLPHHFHIDNS